MTTIFRMGHIVRIGAEVSDMTTLAEQVNGNRDKFPDGFFAPHNPWRPICMRVEADDDWFVDWALQLDLDDTYAALMDGTR